MCALRSLVCVYISVIDFVVDSVIYLIFVYSICGVKSVCKKEGKVTSTLFLESLWSSWRHLACSNITFNDLSVASESTQQTPKNTQRPPKTCI